MKEHSPSSAVLYKAAIFEGMFKIGLEEEKEVFIRCPSISEKEAVLTDVFKYFLFSVFEIIRTDQIFYEYSLNIFRNPL